MFVYCISVLVYINICVTGDIRYRISVII